MSSEQMSWAQALAQLEEAPPMEQEIRTQYCDVIRREVLSLHEDLRIARGQKKKPSSPAIEPADANPKRVLREALAWCRGTSLSIRVQPEDRQWAEELHTALGALSMNGTITLRPLSDDPTIEDIERSLEAIEKGMAARFRVGIAPTKRRGDILIHGCVARSIGGFDGVSPIITFGVADRSKIEIAEEERAEGPHPVFYASGVAGEEALRNWQGVEQQIAAPACLHDNVTVVFINEKDSPVVRCQDCGATVEAQHAGPPGAAPEGYVEVDMIDPTMTAVESTRRKLEALAFMPSLRGKTQQAALMIAENGTRFFVPTRVASSAERLGLVKNVRWKVV